MDKINNRNNIKIREPLVTLKPEWLINVPGSVTLNFMLELNKLKLEMNKAAIREKYPNISKKEMLIKLNRLYWKDNKYEIALRKCQL